MKKWIVLLALSASAPVFADAASDELMSAQAAFRQALSNQTSGQGKIADLQNRLQSAQSRKAALEAEITKLSAELTEAQQAQTTYDGTLKAAGDRLNAAWQAVHGN